MHQLSNPEVALGAIMGAIAVGMIVGGTWYLKYPGSTEVLRKFLRRIDF